MMKRFKSEEGKRLIYESYNKLLTLWGVDLEQTDIETTFGSTHVITVGQHENPPLLLFHGVGDNSALMWIYNIQELARHFFVIAADTIGGPGKSEPNEHYFKSFTQAQWIDDILNAFNIDSAYIAGVSNGAYLTQHYAMKRPERVPKIVCMSGSIACKSAPNPLFRMMKVFLPEALIPTEKNARKLLRKMCGPNSTVFENNQELMRHWVYLLKYFNNRAMMSHKIVRFGDNEIATIRDKALFLLGDCDRLSYHDAAIKAFQEHRLNYKIVQNAGHALNHEQADLINGEIVRFLLS
ncbi:MAG: alpha/beta hydrolase [Clostridia bacterium]|nr:alpha/beta hydrolase [Clostridia bacterium]